MRLIPLAFSAFALLAACANSTETRVIPGSQSSQTVPGGNYDAASFCGALCDRSQTCDQSLDVQTCKNSCTNSYAAVFPKLRGDVVDLVVGCFDGKDCKTVLGGDVVPTCIEDAVASVAPSAAADAYCDAAVKAKKKCSVTVTKASCLTTAKLYGDEAIAQAQNCTARPCGEIDACVQASFGSIGSTTGGPKTPSASCTGMTELGSCQTCAETSCCDEAAACKGDPYCRSLLAACTVSLPSSSSSTCASTAQSVPSSAMSLAQTYFTCAQSSCGSSCGTYVAF